MKEEGEGSKVNKYFQLNYEYAKANKKNNNNDKGNTETNNTSAIVVEKRGGEKGKQENEAPAEVKSGRKMFSKINDTLN